MRDLVIEAEQVDGQLDIFTGPFDEINALADMIRERVDQQTARYRNLVIEVAHHLSITHPADEEQAYVALPTVLVALIREATRDTE
jgi:hypothetical protein